MNVCESSLPSRSWFSFSGSPSAASFISHCRLAARFSSTQTLMDFISRGRPRPAPADTTRGASNSFNDSLASGNAPFWYATHRKIPPTLPGGNPVADMINSYSCFLHAQEFLHRECRRNQPPCDSALGATDGFIVLDQRRSKSTATNMPAVEPIVGPWRPSGTEPFLFKTRMI